MGRIKASNNPKREINLCVSATGLYYFDTKTNDVISKLELSEVTFVHLNAKDPKSVSIISTNESLGLMSCHCFKVSRAF
jgi:hypothetical protein